jgi:hypothetical protein
MFEFAGLGNRYFSDPMTDALEESEEVVDSFFNSCSTKNTSSNGSGDNGEVNLESLEIGASDLLVYKGRKKNSQNIIENNW